MHPIEELTRREMELIQAGDDEGVAAPYSSDFVLHYPGRNPLAGRYTDVGQLELFARCWRKPAGPNRRWLVGCRRSPASNYRYEPKSN